MKQNLNWLLLIALLLPFLTQSQTTGVYRQHAEYEPTEAVWMLYPQIIHKRDFPTAAVTTEMIKALAPFVKIKLVVMNDSIEQLVRNMLPAPLLKDGSVTVLKFPYQEFWARDIGPVFVTNNKGEKAIADFNFNDWGYNDTTDAAARLDEKLDERIAVYYNVPLISTPVVSEGGDREVNGKGVLLMVEAVEKQRNPGLTLEQMEPEYKRLLGVSKIIWLKQGVRDDDQSFYPPIEGPGGKRYYTMLTTGGHVDEFARFVNDSTILLAEVSDAERISDMEKQTGKRMDVNFEILRKVSDQNGNPFHIIRMPMPYPVTTQLVAGDSVYAQLKQLQTAAGLYFPNGAVDCVAAASYLNFLVANDVVLVGKYWKKGLPEKIKKRDEEARQILQYAFPGKKIIAMDALAINYGGGGMHCITMNEPAVR